MAVLALSAASWACIAGPTLEAPNREVKAGEPVALKGISYNRNPVLIRFNALDGPVLATIEPTGGTATGSNWNLEGTVTIPAGTQPGNYVLIATQSSPDGKLSQIPTRALVTVIGDTTPVIGAPIAPAQAERPVALERGEAVSTGAKVLVGVGAAGISLFVAGLAALMAGRRKEPELVPARTGTS